MLYTGTPYMYEPIKVIKHEIQNFIYSIVH